MGGSNLHKGQPNDVNLDGFEGVGEMMRIIVRKCQVSARFSLHIGVAIVGFSTVINVSRSINHQNHLSILKLP